jgi:hypothetical protein
MKQIRSAARIARQIQLTERTLDQTILEANSLLTAMIEARREGNFAAEIGQAAFEDVARTVKTLMDARGAIVSGHTNLAKVADDLAIEWRMDGPLEEKERDRETPHTFRVKEREAA